MSYNKLYTNCKANRQLDYQTIDKLVAKYKTTDSQDTQNALCNRLLEAFHNYFLKYVALLKNNQNNLNNSDTMSFLALFLPGSSKTAKAYRRISNYIRSVCRDLDGDDIYNQMVMFFCLLLREYTPVENVSFTYYVTQYMKWYMQRWIMRMSRYELNKCELLTQYGLTVYDEHARSCRRHPPITGNPERLQNNSSKNNSISIPLPVDESVFELTRINLHWVFYGGSNLFDNLTLYERFLIYLNYEQSMSIRQIAELLGRAPNSIHSHLTQAIKTLQEVARNNKEDV